jgi:hypothetical protein
MISGAASSHLCDVAPGSARWIGDDLGGRVNVSAENKAKCHAIHIKQLYWELVESYCNARSSRQRTVAYLCKLGRKETRGWQKLSGQLDGQARPLLGLSAEPGDDGESNPFE